MKLLVISDTHGSVEKAVELIRKGNYDAVIHLGDLVRDAEAIRAKLDIPANEEIMSVIAVGKRAEDPSPRPRKAPEEVMKFFDDLCTVSELQAMEQRYQVAVLLNEGLIYNDILEKTGASSATISRVNRSLQYGADGYAVAFKRLKEQAQEE